MLLLTEARSTEDWLIIVLVIIAIICGVVWLIKNLR
jgi:hypothetical protein